MIQTVGEIIKSYLKRKQQLKPGYSLRAFARDLDISPSFLSDIIKGKRKLPVRLINRVKNILDIEDEAILKVKSALVGEELKQLIPQIKGNKQKEKHPYKLLSAKDFSLISQWYFPLLVDLTTTSNFSSDINQISKRTQLSADCINTALETLVKYGFLEYSEGVYKKRTEKIRIASNRKMTEIRQFHSAMLDRAKLEITDGKKSQENFSRRLICGTTLACDSRKVDLARHLLNEAVKEISELLSTGDCDEVYHLAVQLFPLTQKA